MSDQSTDQPFIIHLNKNYLKVKVDKVWGGVFATPQQLTSAVSSLRSSVERRMRKSLEGLTCRVMIPGGEVVLPLNVSVDFSIGELKKVMDLPNRPPEPLRINWGKAYHKLLDHACYANMDTPEDSIRLSRLRVEGLITDAGTLTPTGQDIFDQLARMKLDDGFTICTQLLKITQNQHFTNIIRRTLELGGFAGPIISNGKRWDVTQLGYAWLKEHAPTHIAELDEVSLVALAVRYLPLEMLPPYITHSQLAVRRVAQLRAESINLQEGTTI